MNSNLASRKTSRNLDSDTVYFGEVSNVVQNGQETSTYQNGRQYIGKLNNGRRHGCETSNFRSGEKYVREHKHDKRQRQGTFAWSDRSV